MIVTCSSCGGNGAVDGGMDFACPVCGGAGKTTAKRNVDKPLARDVVPMIFADRISGVLAGYCRAARGEEVRAVARLEGDWRAASEGVFADRSAECECALADRIES